MSQGQKNTPEELPPEALVTLAVLQERVKYLDEVRTDVKTLLSSVNRIEVSLATKPSFDDLTPLKTRLRDLEDKNLESQGSWKVITAVGTVVGGVVGSIASYLPSWIHKLFGTSA